MDSNRKRFNYLCSKAVEIVYFIDDDVKHERHSFNEIRIIFQLLVLLRFPLINNHSMTTKYCCD